jgi:hypothetical protein
MKLAAIFRRVGSAAVTLALLGWVVTSEWEAVRAYSLIGATYPGNSVTYKVNPGFPDAPAGTPAQQITALQNAAASWQSQSGIDFGFSYGGQTSVSTVAFDGTNAVFYSDTDGGGALAVCYYWMGAGTMYQFDIQFFDSDGAYDFIWSLMPSVAQFDIQSVATHEFGHALGLGHSGVATSTMYPSVSPGDTGGRTLHADDIAGAQTLYGVAGPTVTSCSPPSAWVDGGVPVTITGTGFSATNLQVQFANVAATNVVYVSPTQVTCTAPAAPQYGTVSVQVCCGGQCGSANAFSYDTIRVMNPPTVGGVSWIEFKAPTLASHVYQGFASLGSDGIPLNQYGNAMDPRVLPVTFDGLLYWQLTTPINWFPNFYAQLNATGSSIGFFGVPNDPQVDGVTFHFSWLVWDQTAQSGVALVGNHVSATVQ